MLITIVIPAFNEEKYLPRTLTSISSAIANAPCPVELIVVDNASSDRTAEIARASGACVLYEPAHNVARVRNTGAASARGDVLVFVDADTLVPPECLTKIAAAMRGESCIGGSADIVHEPASRLLRIYCAAWRWIGVRLGISQGALQFCRSSAFRVLHGFDESRLMGEDVDFYWRLHRLGLRTGGHVAFLESVQVFPSPRRFDTTPVWKTLIWTNPAFILLFRHVRAVWSGWYVAPPR